MLRLPLPDGLRLPRWPGKRQRLRLKLPRVLLRRLRQESAQSGRSPSDLIMQALVEFLERQEQRRRLFPPPQLGRISAESVHSSLFQSDKSC